ncbi:MAG: recombinase family protein [Lachnospiraceae bacterium]|nr:recombinase family protein [Lachnospiraceae bacterium]
MIYGYARISRPSQNIQRQIRNIQEYEPTAVIIEEAYTGTTQSRPKWQKLLNNLEKGDVVIFDSVSRMSRNADEGFSEYQALYNREISLIFLKEPHISTSVYRQSLTNSIEMTGNQIADEYIAATNRVLMILAEQQIRLAFQQSEKEVSDLHQRTVEGIATARINGKQIGQRKGAKLNVKKSQPAKEMIKKYSKTFGGSLSNDEVLKLAGISHATYYKYRRELLTELEQQSEQEEEAARKEKQPQTQCSE